MLTIGAQFFLANLISLVGISVVLALSINWKLPRRPGPPSRASRLFWRRISGCGSAGGTCAPAVLNDNLSGVRVVKASRRSSARSGASSLPAVP